MAGVQLDQHHIHTTSLALHLLDQGSVVRVRVDRELDDAQVDVLVSQLLQLVRPCWALDESVRLCGEALYRIKTETATAFVDHIVPVCSCVELMCVWS